MIRFSALIPNRTNIVVNKAVQVKKKRPLKEILAEKEAQQKLEAERRVSDRRCMHLHRKN